MYQKYTQNLTIKKSEKEIYLIVDVCCFGIVMYDMI